jgi:hypothetical protein
VYVGMVGHKLIPLWSREGNLQGLAVVDQADAKVVDMAHAVGRRWRLVPPGYVAYTPPRESARYLHREILGLVPGDGLVVDHINGNPLDCRRSNMRACTQGENLQNTASRVGFASAYRGVSWATREGKWMARAVVRGKTTHLGYFDDELEAASAAQKYRREHMTHTNEDRHPLPVRGDAS